MDVSFGTKVFSWLVDRFPSLVVLIGSFDVSNDNVVNRVMSVVAESKSDVWMLLVYVVVLITSVVLSALIDLFDSFGVKLVNEMVTTSIDDLVKYVGNVVTLSVDDVSFEITASVDKTSVGGVFSHETLT